MPIAAIGAPQNLIVFSIAHFDYVYLKASIGLSCLASGINLSTVRGCHVKNRFEMRSDSVCVGTERIIFLRTACFLNKLL